MILNTITWGKASGGIPLETSIIDGTITSYKGTVNSLERYAFAYCTSLSVVSLLNCTKIGSSAFAQCSYLEAAYIYWTATNSSIWSYAFYSCWRLKSLYLLGSQVKPLYNQNAFMSTPISTYTTQLGTNGSIFVPSSILASYQAATNWSWYSARFVGLTDTEMLSLKTQMGIV